MDTSNDEPVPAATYPASFILLYQEPVIGSADGLCAGTQTHTNAREDIDQDSGATRTRTDAREADDNDMQALHSVFGTVESKLRAAGTNTKTGGRENEDDDIGVKHSLFLTSMGTETVTKSEIREQGDTDLSSNRQTVFPSAPGRV